MNYLAIDTSTQNITIALQSNDQTYTSTNHSKTHLNDIALHTQNLLKQANISVNDLNFCINGAGPGSFTGLRISLSFLKGLIAGLGIPLINISSLKALSYAYKDQNNISIIDARKNRFYVFDNQSNQEYDYDLLDIEKLINKPTILLGNAKEIIYENINSDLQKFCIINQKENLSYGLLHLGLLEYNKQNFASEFASPLYIRSSDAKLPQLK